MKTQKQKEDWSDYETISNRKAKTRDDAEIQIRVAEAVVIAIEKSLIDGALSNKQMSDTQLRLALEATMKTVPYSMIYIDLKNKKVKLIKKLK